MGISKKDDKDNTYIIINQIKDFMSNDNKDIRLINYD